jgi:hypothetical protein
MPSQHGQGRQHGRRDDPSRVPVRPVPLRWRAGQHRGHAEAAGQALAPLTHQLVMVPPEHWPGRRRQQVHPSPGGADIPVVADQGAAIGGGKRPAASAIQLTGSPGFQPERRLHAGHLHVETERVRQPGPEQQAQALADPIISTRFQLVHAGYVLSPGRPALGVVNLLPDPLNGRLDLPRADKVILSHVSSCVP